MAKLLIFFFVLFISITMLVITLQFDKTINTTLLHNTPTQTLIPTPTLEPFPEQKILSHGKHIFQTFNNCGPAALSMALSYYGINESQEILGDILRPYQRSNGDNDDKSVTLEELAQQSRAYDFIPIHRPNGNPELVKRFLTYDIPVITRTWLKMDDDIGHYRIIKGFDDRSDEFIQDDSLQGKDIRYKYDAFNALWKKYNYEYLVLIPKEQQHIIELILGKDIDERTAWDRTIQTLTNELERNPYNKDTRFNLSVAYFHTGQYQQSIEQFEKVEHILPSKTLWYQIEPIEAYYQIGDYEKVLTITDSILNNNNRAFSELYYLRGLVFENQSKKTQAIKEYKNALFYNKHFSKALEKINSLTM